MSAPLPDEPQFARELAALVAGDVIEAPNGLHPDSDLYEAGLDSMGIMRLVMLVEERFGLSLPDAAMTRDAFATPLTLAQHLRTHGRPTA